jgi:hemerythrin
MKLGVSLMDEDHATLEAMFAAAATVPEGELASLRDTILTEIGEHFAREEDLMRRNGFPGLECHMEEHRRLVDLLWRAAHDDAQDLRRTLSVTALETVEEHVESIDYVTALFLKGEAVEAA